MNQGMLIRKVHNLVEEFRTKMSNLHYMWKDDPRAPVDYMMQVMGVADDALRVLGELDFEGPDARVSGGCSRRDLSELAVAWIKNVGGEYVWPNRQSGIAYRPIDHLNVRDSWFCAFPKLYHDLCEQRCNRDYLCQLIRELFWLGSHDGVGFADQCQTHMPTLGVGRIPVLERLLDKAKREVRYSEARIKHCESYIRLPDGVGVYGTLFASKSDWIGWKEAKPTGEMMDETYVERVAKAYASELTSKSRAELELEALEFRIDYLRLCDDELYNTKEKVKEKAKELDANRTVQRTQIHNAAQ